MKRYKNTKTGATVDTMCEVSGGDWVSEEDIVESDGQTEFDEEDADEQVSIKKRSKRGKAGKK